MADVSIRYARALADVIDDAKLDAAQSAEQLNALVAAFQESRELREVWESPAIPGVEKLKVLDAITARVGITARQIRNFIAVLIDQGRILLLPEIAKQLEIEINRRIGRVDALIVSAREMSSGQRDTLIGELTRITGKTILPHYAMDSKLIGGVTVRVGSTVFDGSVRGQLQRIRQQLTES